MRIAIDYDGTFMTHPELYTNLGNAFQEAGMMVGCMTGRCDDTKNEDFGRLFKHLFYPVFFFNSSEMNVHELEVEKKILDGDLNMDRDELVCMFKARICHEKGIDILFDDAADKIRLYLPEGCQTVIFKSPTEHNMVVKKWGKAHTVEYGGES